MNHYIIIINVQCTCSHKLNNTLFKKTIILQNNAFDKCLFTLTFEFNFMFCTILYLYVYCIYMYNDVEITTSHHVNRNEIS